MKKWIFLKCISHIYVYFTIYTIPIKSITVWYGSLVSIHKYLFILLSRGGSVSTVQKEMMSVDLNRWLRSRTNFFYLLCKRICLLGHSEWVECLVEGKKKWSGREREKERGCPKVIRRRTNSTSGKTSCL